MKDAYASLSTLESLVAQLHSIEWPREELLADARHEAAAEQALATQAQQAMHVAVLSRELSVSETAVSEMTRAAELAGGQLDWAQEELERMEAKLEYAEAQVGGLREQLASLAAERAHVEGFQQQIIEHAERDVQTARAAAAAAVADAEKKLREAEESTSAAAGISASRVAADASARLIDRAEGAATRTAELEAQLATSKRHASELEAELQQRDEELHALKSASPAGRAEAEARREAEALAQDLFARERDSLRAAAAEIAGRETRLLDSQEMLAAELAELQGLLAGQESYGEALVRLSQERQQAHGELGPAKRRVRELEEETARLQGDCDRLRARNATLLERERRRRQAPGE